MVIDVALAVVAILLLWSARSVYATAVRVYRGIPLTLFPELRRGVRQRLGLALAFILVLAFRIWG